MGGSGNCASWVSLVQTVCRIDKLVGDAHDDEGGSDEHDVWDDH